MTAYLLPFSYFYRTRLKNGSIAFHVAFEWLAAIFLITILAPDALLKAFTIAFASYLAFISLYEIGYIYNDVFASPHETSGRKRAPLGATKVWIALWVTSRVTCFGVATVVSGHASAPQWWSFFGALAVVFALHNSFRNSEHKTVTFLWLAWFRFMAPLTFVVPDDEYLGIGLSAALGYCSFRFLAYLDSKSLLAMNGRQESAFRLIFFIVPLVGVVALWPAPGATGFMLLTTYNAIIALLGTIVAMLKARRNNSKGAS